MLVWCVQAAFNFSYFSPWAGSFLCSSETFVNPTKLPATVLAWENLQEVFVVLVVIVVLHSLLFNVFVKLVVAVAVFHSLLFGVIPHPCVSYHQVFTPIFYFQARSSQSDSWCFHFNLSGPFCYSFIASATVLRGCFLPTGVFYLTLLPDIFGTTYFSRSPWDRAVLPWSLQGFMLIHETQTWPICLFESQQDLQLPGYLKCLPPARLELFSR